MQNTHRRATQRLAHIGHLKAAGYTMTINKEEVEAMIHTPGLTHSDFDSKSGFPNPWQIMKFIGAARYFAHHNHLDDSERTFRDYAQMTADRFTFMVTAVFEFKPSLLDLSSPKCPLDVKIKGGYIGNTSCNSIATVLTESGEELFSNISQVVSIDQSTRRPMPLPDWWKEKYAKSAEKSSSLKFERYHPPTGLDPFRITVMRSDVDRYNHTNWSSYVRFASDAVSHFSKHGQLPHFQDMDRKGLKKMELFYSQESYDGDVLDVQAWEQADNTERIHIQIYKNSNFLFQATFEYFEGYMY